ncbi:MAG: insulinase family protein, partial [Thermoguttaceae bacterium]|nr:insulinase family protein [Thermoguttaceae bacterium]
RSGSVEEKLTDAFAQAVPRESTYAVPTEGTAESIASATLDDLRAFWRQIFSPQNLIVGVDGPLEGTTAKNRAFELLKAIPANPNFRPINFDRPCEPSQAIRRFELEEGAIEGGAILAAPIPAAVERTDIAALTVLQAIWEGADGDGGRLAERLKNNFDGDCDFRVELTPGPAPSYMTIQWRTEPENLPEATRRVLGMITEAVESLISEETCAGAKKQIILRRNGRYVGLKERTSRLILDEFYRVAPETLLTERERELEEAILQVAAADVARVAKKYWEHERVIGVIVSPIALPGFVSGSGNDDARAAQE